MTFEERQLLQWWLDKDPLTDKEKLDIYALKSEKPESNNIEYNNICQKYFNLMPFCNISSDTHTILCEETATNFINKLFDKYATDETLVICSNNEHDNVKKRLDTCKNVLIVNNESDIRNLKINKIIEESKKYKKVFVYIIGTQISSGEITSQRFFIQLKQEFIKNNIEHCMILDDVHGMFMVPRDYSIFDYILYTAHALILHFNIGLLICKKDTDILGYKAYNWLTEYYDALQVILKRQEKLRMFHNIMYEHISKYLKYPDFSFIPNSASHIFAPVLKKHKPFDQSIFDTLNTYGIRLDGALDVTAPKTFLRFRAATFIKEPEKLIPGLELLESVLDMFDYK